MNCVPDTPWTRPGGWPYLPPECPYCGSNTTHPVGACPNVAEIEYYANGAIKRVVLRNPDWRNHWSAWPRPRIVWQDPRPSTWPANQDHGVPTYWHA